MRSVEDQSKASAEPRADVKSEVARTLIEAMEQGNTPWQKPWTAQSLRPINATTNNAYRGINLILLGLSGRTDPRWMTYQQAQAQGWQVRRGERGTGIVKLVEVGAGQQRGGHQGAAVEEARGQSDSRSANGQAGHDQDQGADGSARRAFALRKYTVFNAQQIDGVPELEAPEAKPFDPIERAEAVIDALKKTGLRVAHGGNRACYRPATDEIKLPRKESFHSVYDYYAAALHEGAHSTMSKNRLDRREAIANRWGDEAYAVEELRAEICSAILAAETGVSMSQAHIDNHAAYLKSWVRAIESDPMAIFSAAKDADFMAQYMLGVEKQMVSLDAHEEWVADYDRHR